MKTYNKNFISALLLSSALAIRASDTDFDDLFNPDTDDHFNAVLEAKQASNTSCLPPQDILDILTSPEIGAQYLLATNFYNQTNPPHTRPLLSLPTLITYPISSQEDDFCDHVRVSGFYNQTHSMYFNKNNSNLSSYINFANPTLLQKLEDLKNFGINIPAILPLFAQMKLQERRFGLCLGATGYRNNFSVTVDMPVYYMEHNFYLTPQEEKALQENPELKAIMAHFAEEESSQAVSINSAEASRAFAKEHLSNDKLGTGDAFLRVFYTISDKDCLRTLIGLHTVWPTAHTFQEKFFIGGTFDKDEPQPSFNFQDFFNLLTCGDEPDIGQIKKVASAFAVSVLDRLSGNEVDLPLGNNGHFGFGPVIKCTSHFSRSWSLQFDGYGEYQIPGNETRFFLTQKNPADFERDYTNAADAAANLQFLSTQFVNTLFPCAVNTRVTPGFQIVATGQLIGEWKHGHLRGGLDYWHQGKERLAFDKESFYNTSNLQVGRGRINSAYQLKIFGETGYRKEAKNLDWTVNLGGDYTFAHAGIGKDWTVVLTTRFYF